MTRDQVNQRVEKMLAHLEQQLFAGNMSAKDFASNVEDLGKWASRYRGLSLTAISGGLRDGSMRVRLSK